MQYISSREAADKWGISLRQAQQLLHGGRIPGARKYGVSWLIPADCEKPLDPRRTRKLPRETASPYLPYVFLVGAFEKPEGAGLPPELPDEAARAQYRAELAYLRGDFAAVLAYAADVPPSSPVYLCACAAALAASMSLCDYAAYQNAEAKLKGALANSESRQTALLVEAALATAAVSMLAPDLAPGWLKDGNFACLPEQSKPWAAYLYVKYLQNRRDYASQLAAGKTALGLLTAAQRNTTSGVYLLLLCAAASYALGDVEEAARHLTEALAIGLPRGFTTPFAENVTVFGGMLEQRLEADWPDYYPAIAEQPETAWKNWFAFHNQFTKDNITLILTLQEYWLAQFLSGGMTYAEAARRMHLSVGRVKNMVTAIYSKLGIGSKQALRQFVL